MVGILRSGDLAVIRGRRWRVAWVTPHGDCTSIRVASHDPSVAPITFLSPFDEVHPIRQSAAIKRISRRKAVAALGRAIHDTAPFPALVATSDAAIDLLPYQLEPALALLAGTATRVLVADDVGLGKTIQAGIVIKELAARNEANHVLLIVPAGLVDQWSDELRGHFALAAEHVDATWLRLMARSLPPWVNPWTLPGILLVSIDLLKRPEVLAQIAHVAWDLVVIDEAHRATGATDRHRVAAHVCSRATRIVLLTATPHAGDDEAFREIQELGAVLNDEMRMVTFARTRLAVAPLAVRRRARYFRVPLSGEEQVMHAALERYARRVLRLSRASERDSLRLAMMVLKKRALSGAFSLRRSLARRLAAMNEPADAPAQLGLRFDPDPAGELVGDDEEPDACLLATASDAVPHEREHLASLIALAAAATPGESKLRFLRRALAMTREHAIIFTEYRDTLEHVAAEIAGVGPLVLHGGLASEERRAVISAFARGDGRVLVATDAAAEGLNLHERCRWVINLELPWAPLRLIQRAGRVDRIGQRRRVHAWHLVANGTDETRLLLSLSMRAEAAESALARERALGEQAVAAALLDGDDTVTEAKDLRASIAPHATNTSGRREKARLECIRAISTRATNNSLPQPGVAFVKRRRGFARYLSGDRLLVFAGRALDGQRCVISTRLGAAQTRRVHPGNELERQLRTDIRRFQRAARVMAARRRAVAALLRSSRAPVQPALFDRRALDSRDAVNRAIAGAERQLTTVAAARTGQLSQQPSAEPAAESSVLFELVTGFEVK